MLCLPPSVSQRPCLRRDLRHVKLLDGKCHVAPFPEVKLLVSVAILHHETLDLQQRQILESHDNKNSSVNDQILMISANNQIQH